MSSSSPERPPRIFWQCWPVVWLAGWIVPRASRREWRERWRKQLWHWALFLQESGRNTPQARHEMAAYSWRAFIDALWHRFKREDFLRDAERTLRGPGFCLGACAAILLAVILFSGLLPVSRSILMPLPYGDADRVGIITYLFRTAVPSNWVRVWAQEKQTFEDVAEYSFQRRTISGVPHVQRALVGEVSTDFFNALQARPQMGTLFNDQSAADCMKCAVMSSGFWRRYLNADRNVIGRQITVEGTTYKIVGVLPRNFWFFARDVAMWVPMAPPPAVQPEPAPNLVPRTIQLEGRTMTVWLPAEQDANSPTLPVPRLVSTVVRLKPGVTVKQAESTLQKVTNEMLGRRAAAVAITPVSRQVRQVAYPYLTTIAVVLIVCLATAYFRLRHCVSNARRTHHVLRWWGLLVGKISLLLIAAAFAAIELVPVISDTADQAFDPSAWPLSMWLCVAFSVAALLWSLYDQRYRCPVCLSRLTLPVLVGDAGRMLLGHGATEFVCPRGHGMLHVSDMPCSWIDAEQWTRMDESWDELFNDEKVPSLKDPERSEGAL